MRLLKLACVACLFVSPVAADDKPDEFAALKAAKEYCYPKSETGKNSNVGRASVIPTTTDDDFQKVVEWYETKTGAKTTRQKDGKLALSGGRTHGGGPSDRVNEWYIVEQDSEQEKGKPRPLQFCQFVRETKTHLLVVAITRADKEDKTHIVVTYIVLAGKEYGPCSVCVPPTLKDVKKDGDKKDGDKKDKATLPQDKWNLEYAEKKWGLTVKTIEYVEKTDKLAFNHYRFLLEFNKNLSDEELSELNKALMQSQTKWEIVFFDADNVIQEKIDALLTSEGEITGKKGNAFRLMILPPKKDKLVRAELRAKK